MFFRGQKLKFSRDEFLETRVANSREHKTRDRHIDQSTVATILTLASAMSGSARPRPSVPAAGIHIC